MPSSLLGALWVVPALPLLGFLLNGALALWRPHAKTAVSAIGVGVLVLACAAAVAAVAGFAGLHPAAPLVFRYWEWMPVGDLRIDFALQLDQLSAVMVLVVTGVGALIHVFSVGYMHEDAGYARYFAYLNLFVFFMLVLVLGASFPVMFVGWEGVGLCSYLLIGYWFNEQINADAGKKAFIVNRIGDVGFLIAMLLIFRATGSLDFGPVFARAGAVFTPAGATVTAVTLFLFLGSGSVIHAMHDAYHLTHAHDDAQDMRNMGGLRRHLPWTATLMWIATLAIAGIPPLSGFFSKDEILGAAFALGTAEPVWLLYWAMGIAAALLTAFYMTRLMLYTFHGPNRTGDQARTHLHEAPWVMTAPLVVLGVLSVVGGAFNLPELVDGKASLQHWLAPVSALAGRMRPVVELSKAVEWMLVGGAVVVAALGIVGAVRQLHPETLVPARLAPSETGLRRLLWKKWYVDEIYDAVIVRPVQWLAREVLWKTIDVRLVDGLLVNGSATTSRALGWLGSRLQTGEVGFYVALFVVGVLVVVGAAMR